MPEIGKKLPENIKSEVQSVLFNVNNWSIGEAKTWLKENNFTRLGVETTENKYRFRQFDPELFKRFATKSLDGGIQLVIGFTKQKDKEKKPKIKLYKAEIDFEAIDDFMDENDFPLSIKEHVLGMINNFNLGEISLMTNVFDKLIREMSRVQLIKSDIDMNMFELDLDNINNFMELNNIQDEFKNLINELLGNFKITDLIDMGIVFDKIERDIRDRIWEIKHGENKDTEKSADLASFIKHKLNKEKEEYIKKYAIDKRKVKLLKETAESEKRLVYGVVAEPELIDTDNQWYDSANIENACHNFMKFFKEVGIDHQFIIREGMDIVENYISPSNMIINGTLIKKGSWVMVHHVSDDDIWEEVKSGELEGYSFEGLGILVDQTP